MSLEKARTGKPSRYLNDEGRLDFKMRQYAGLTPPLKPTVILTVALLCALLPISFAVEAPAVDGGEKAGVSASTEKSRTFNVLNYGAVGDDKTDNTEAFSACLKAVLAAGGGKIFIPDGIYRGRIIIPGTKEWITVEIVGESESTPVFGTVGAFPFPKNGTIIKCLSESGSAVISSANAPGKLYDRFSGVNVSLRNLDIRTYDNPGIGGIDLLNSVQCKLENVFVNTDIYNVQASKPTHGKAGISTPACNNGALTILRNVVVTGYHTGILVNEHTDGDNINLASNINGLKFNFAHHASWFGRVGAQRCTRSVTVSGNTLSALINWIWKLLAHGRPMKSTSGRQRTSIFTIPRISAVAISTTGLWRGM